MARIVVVSAAYLGDVAPFVPPANLLAERGHDVTFLTPTGFHRLFQHERFGLATYPLDFPPSGMHADEKHERLMRRPMMNTLRLGRYWMHKAFTADPPAVQRAVTDTLRGADAVVSHPTMATVVQPVAQAMEVPLVIGQLFPMLIPTAEWGPPVGQRSYRLGRPLNRMSWKVAARLAALSMDARTTNRYRQGLGLPPLRSNALMAWQAAARTV